MSNLIISKKGRAPAYLTTCALLVLGIAVLTFYTSGFDTDFGYKMEIHELLALASPFFLITAGIMMATSAYRHGQTHISVYTDHIEGCGVCGKGGTRSQTFYLTAKNAYTITREGSFVCVSCNNSSYYINLSPAEAQQVYDAAIKGQYQSESPGNFSATPKPEYNAPKPNSAGSFSEMPKSEPVQSNPNTVFECPTCRAKCRIPFVKGKIKINCPKCKNSFIVEN